MNSLSSSLIRFLIRNLRTTKRLISGTVSQGSEKIRFDGQTAIVTGAGRGLGKEYALLLASRGANVVINDYNGSRSGEVLGAGDLENAANLVVEEICRLYPQANVMADYSSVSDEAGARGLVDKTMKRFNSVQILINNAGILRDKSFAKMTIEDWDLVNGVHLRGSFLMSHFCWPIMRAQKYGKIVMTSSTSGLYGNFGQANYAAAKMGLIGLSNTLAIEGKSSNISCNTIVPMAASRMTQDIIPEELARRLKPAYVAPLVVYLCHANCQTSGSVIEAAGRWFGRHRLQRSAGSYLSEAGDRETSLEQLAASWQEICSDFSSKKTTQAAIETFHEHLGELMSVFEKNRDQ